MKTDEALQLMEYLDKGSNIFGPLQPEVRSRLYAVVENPIQETWDGAHGIILSGESHVTLWQACVRYGGYEIEIKYPEHPWPVVPTRDQILIALKVVLS